MQEQACAYCDSFVKWIQTNGPEYGMRVVAALVIFVLGAIAIRVMSAVLRKALGRFANKAMAVNFIISVAVKVSWAFLIVVILGKLGVDVGPLVAGLGVTGFILGFAFQESLGSLAAGLMIALNQPFRVGDYVTVAGFEGVIASLDMMAVTIATGDLRRVTIPNKQAWGSPIVNFSALDTRRVDLSFGIEYGADIAKAKEIILATLAKVPGALQDPAPTVALGSLNESEVSLGSRVWCKNADYWPVRNAAIEAVHVELAKAGLTAPYSHVDVHMV